MGYCPYICVCCGKIEDNGWHGYWDQLSNDDRVAVKMYYIIYMCSDKLPFYNIKKRGYYDKEHDEIIGPDVCHSCFGDSKEDKSTYSRCRDVFDEMPSYRIWEMYILNYRHLEEDDEESDYDSDEDDEED